MANIKQIDGFSDYLIHEDGYVMTLKKRVKRLKFGHKPTPNGSYYRYVNLWKDGRMYPMTIHRMVAGHFVANPENKPEVNHKDGDKLNNHYTNLEWTTRKENASHAAALGLYPRGETQPASKFRESDIIAIRQMHSKGMSISKIYFKYSVRYNTIRKIIKRETWKHIA